MPYSIREDKQMATRRGHGEGSIFKRKLGGKVVGWMAMLDLGFENGKRKRQTFYGRDRAAVQQKLDDARQKLSRGLFVGGPKLTTAEWLKRWLSDVAKPNVRPSTFKSYRDLLGQHVIPALGRIPLERLSPSDVRQMMNAVLSKGLSARTVHHIRAVLRNALHQAERDGLIQRNAAALAEPPRVVRQEMKSLTPDQARIFQQAIKGDPIEALCITALDSGMRQGEVLGLRWQDVDLATGTIRVVHALQRVNGKLVLVEPKSRTSRRAVKLGALASQVLRDHRASQVNGRLELGGRWVDLDFVFTGPYGVPLDGVGVTKRFQQLLKAAALPRIRFHDLRHTSASLLFGQHVAARVVMERLGHSNISLTLGTYSHLIPELNQEAADAMDRALGV